MNRRTEGNRRVDWHVQAIDAIEDLLFRKIPQELVKAPSPFALANFITKLYHMRDWHRRQIETAISEFQLDQITAEDLEGSVWNALEIDLSWMEEN